MSQPEAEAEGKRPSLRAATRRRGTAPARERDVLRLIAAGRTNREIGAELFISPKAAFAHRRGLDG